MSHAERFLSRLVRLADDEVKLALSLYHDSAWVREVLRSNDVPEAAERVAMSLDDSERGPFVVVTRGARQELDEMMLRLACHHFEEQIDLAHDDVARDVALTLSLLSWTDGITDGRKLGTTFNLAAAASELSAERFYLPRVALDELRQPWNPEHTWKMLDPMMRAVSSGGPVRGDEPKPGRNAPCPCGSGKKLKRCCGA